MHYLVVGAGYTGQRVVTLLPGEHTTGLRRTELDLDDGGGRALRMPAPCAVLCTVPPAIGDGEDRRLLRLFDALADAPRRFVYLSTTGVYGDCGGRVVDEDSPVRPSSDRARARVAAERTARRLCDERNTACFILRVPGIYGPGRLGLERIRDGVPVIAEAEAGPGNRIHVDDLAGCAVAALTRDVPPGIYNTGDGDHRSATWFSATVARMAGLAPPPAIARNEAESVFSAARLSFLRESRRIDTTKMREVLGFLPRYADPEAGIRASLQAPL